ncbi:glutathionylspermidine synthase family protein [Glaesserella parasuis]|nr:glutathionylspermidine synthase family protein [Glaesserella parasuis]MCT8781899.1 glutathionylspermidine synthase family protein [Glaesserella parasuis]MCT8821587.1 glutathionylspermidine synthase family protein [Glaesserella parasuis]
MLGGCSEQLIQRDVYRTKEDWGNIDYLCETAFLASWNIHQLAVEEDIGYDDESQQFVDLHGNYIDLIFKLYPLEWLTKTDFATYIPTAKTQFIEPMWKNTLIIHFCYQPIFQSIKYLIRQIFGLKKQF